MPPGKEKKENGPHLQTQLNLNKTQKFEPKGLDVQLAQILLGVQIADNLIKISLWNMTYFILLLQVTFSIPLLTISGYLFYRFKKQFSPATMKNILSISTAMLVENGLNLVLRFFTGLKTFFNQESQSGTTAVVNFVIPLFFF